MKQIYSALISLQSELKPVIKDSNNPFFKSKYADFESIIENVSPLLVKNKMGFTQVCRINGEDVVLQTRLFHESGEEIISEMFLPMMADAQKTGSVFTYYKRYMLQAALGLATADDDGNAAKPPEDNYTGKPKQEFVKQKNVEQEKPSVQKIAQNIESKNQLLKELAEIISSKTVGMTQADKQKWVSENVTGKSWEFISKNADEKELKEIIARAKSKEVETKKAFKTVKDNVFKVD